MRTAIIIAALLHQAVCFVAPPVRVAPSLRVNVWRRGPRPDDATAAAAEDAVAAVEDDATPKRRPLRGLWRRIRRKKTEEAFRARARAAAPQRSVRSVVVEATGRSGKVSLVAANGWCQVTYDDEECEGQTETLQCPDLVREEAALAETMTRRCRTSTRSSSSGASRRTRGSRRSAASTHVEIKSVAPARIILHEVIRPDDAASDGGQAGVMNLYRHAIEQASRRGRRHRQRRLLKMATHSG